MTETPKDWQEAAYEELERVARRRTMLVVYGQRIRMALAHDDYQEYSNARLELGAEESEL